MHSYAKFMLHTLNRVEANSSDLVCVSAWFIFMCFTLPNRSQPCQLWLSFSTAMTLHHIILWIYYRNTDTENNNRQISDVSMSFRYNVLYINYIIYSVLYKYDVRFKIWSHKNDFDKILVILNSIAISTNSMIFVNFFTFMSSIHDQGFRSNVYPPTYSND